MGVPRRVILLYTDFQLRTVRRYIQYTGLYRAIETFLGTGYSGRPERSKTQLGHKETPENPYAVL